MVRLVGLAAAVVGFVSSCAYATTVQVSQDGQFNITSPLDNSIYVAGQILPITYRLGDATLCKSKCCRTIVTGCLPNSLQFRYSELRPERVPEVFDGGQLFRGGHCHRCRCVQVLSTD